MTAPVRAATPPQPVAAPAAVTAPRRTAVQAESSLVGYLVAAGLLAVSIVVSVRARRKELALGEVYW